MGLTCSWFLVVEVCFSISGSVLWSGLAEPVFETAGAEQRILARDETLVVHLYAVVACVSVGNHVPRVARRSQILSNKFILPDLVRPGYFDHCIHRFPKSYVCHRGSHIIGNH